MFHQEKGLEIWLIYFIFKKKGQKLKNLATKIHKSSKNFYKGFYWRRVYWNFQPKQSSFFKNSLFYKIIWKIFPTLNFYIFFQPLNNIYSQIQITLNLLQPLKPKLISQSNFPSLSYLFLLFFSFLPKSPKTYIHFLLFVFTDENSKSKNPLY